MTKLEEIARAIYEASTGNNPPDRNPDMDFEIRAWEKWLALARAVVDGPLREPPDTVRLKNSGIWTSPGFTSEVMGAVCDAILAEADKPDAPPV